MSDERTYESEEREAPGRPGLLPPADPQHYPPGAAALAAIDEATGPLTPEQAAAEAAAEALEQERAALVKARQVALGEAAWRAAGAKAGEIEKHVEAVDPRGTAEEWSVIRGHVNPPRFAVVPGARSKSGKQVTRPVALPLEADRAWIFLGAKAYHSWAKGKVLTLEAYDKAIQAFLDMPIGGSSK
jgi:hypothetical protein